MRCFLTVSIFWLILFAQIGCSGDAQIVDSNQNVDSGNTAEPEFNSATEALAEGNQLFDAGETVKAIEALSQAVRLDPDLAEAYFKLGIAYALIEAQDDAAKQPTETPTPNLKGKKPKEEKTNSEKSV